MLTPDSLLPWLKNRLDITWEDGEGDKKLADILTAGIAYFSNLSPNELTFDEGTAERSLLCEYCRYVRCNALSDFSKDYLSEIISFQSREEAKAYVAKQATSLL